MGKKKEQTEIQPKLNVPLNLDKKLGIPTKRKASKIYYTDQYNVERYLTKKQKEFAEYYTLLKYGGVECVVNAGYNVYDKNGLINRNLASSIASENLTKPAVTEYIQLLLDHTGFNDTNVERQHLFLLNQNMDLTNKRGALDMYYKLKGLYSPDKLELSRPYKDLTDAELLELEEKTE